ncbi:MAG TPA: biotin--[acetyl-CoA-carboxylase] ligase [Chitinophagales bacterium]|nr:biotin--[acetyl-CoA-carboxylase] ligase [Chitinophagales bacterium]
MIVPSLNTLFTGKFLIKLNEIDSTNNYLKNWISNNAPIEGAVILAEQQTAGRGQAGTSWQSAAHQNITMSLLYIPKMILAKDQFILSAMIALSIYETLKEFLPQHSVQIKWPNDIMVNRQKVCGILIENTVQGAYIHNCIIGIGLNVLQDNFDNLPLATSMYQNGYLGNTDTVLKRLLETIEKNYLFLKSGKSKEIFDRYHQVLLGKNQSLKFSDLHSEFLGTIQKVATDGRLEILTDHGTRYFYHKEVVFL